MADAYIADATVLIDYLRAAPSAIEFLTPLLDRRAIVLHPAVLAEVLWGARDRRHLVQLDTELAKLKQCSIKSADMLTAIALVRTLTLSHGVGWPDCFIAATCLRLRLPLMTLNDRHFKPIRGLSVIRPY